MRLLIPALRPTRLSARSAVPARSSRGAIRAVAARVSTPLATLSALVVLATSTILPSPPAFAALIATGDGTGNTTAPASDPGFNRVGVVNGLSGVYVSNGWVLTASHVGEGAFVLDGTSYAAVPGSTVRFTNSDSTLADLIAFKLATRPPLTDVAISDNPAALNTLITVIGYGADRGVATSWMGQSGWQWSGSHTKRWGTNRISGIDEFSLDTRAFQITFDNLSNPPAGQHEADVVTGDSGGGAFTGSGSSARLVGILFARATFVGQPGSTSLYGNIGMIVDLYAYRDSILAIIDRPDCNDALDEDRDGLADFPSDPGCASAADTSERGATLVCDNGNDDDGDGLIDFPGDPGCANVSDVWERGASYECDNGVDDDLDLAVDFPTDSGCLHPSNPVEAPEPGLAFLLGAGVLAIAGAARSRSPRRNTRQTSSTRSTR